MNQEKKETIKRAFVETIPIMAGYIVLGFGFGILLSTKRYGLPWAFAMSFFIYAGSIQYVAIDLLTSGASLVVTAFTAFTVNARHLFYGISMIDKYKNAGKKKPYLIFSVTDETYSLVCNDKITEGIENKIDFYFFVSLFNQFYWVASTVAGSLIGSLITFNSQGIDFALTALFITVFTEQWISEKNHFYAFTGLICSIVCLLIFKADKFLIPAMISITLVLTIKRLKEKNTNEHCA